MAGDVSTVLRCTLHPRHRPQSLLSPGCSPKRPCLVSGAHHSLRCDSLGTGPLVAPSCALAGLSSRAESFVCGISLCAELMEARCRGLPPGLGPGCHVHLAHHLAALGFSCSLCKMELPKTTLLSDLIIGRQPWFRSASTAAITVGKSSAALSLGVK